MSPEQSLNWHPLSFHTSAPRPLKWTAHGRSQHLYKYKSEGERYLGNQLHYCLVLLSEIIVNSEEYYQAPFLLYTVL